MNLKQCRRCGADVKVVWHATNKRFCSRDCYDTWWSEYRSTNMSRAAITEKVWGKVPTISLEDHQAAWLAAMIDGEGSIGIWRERKRGNKSGWHYKPAVQVTNSNRQLLERVMACVDGWMHWKNYRRDNPKHKPTFSVLVKRRVVPAVLKRVEPFLVAKRKQAHVVLEFCTVMAAAPARTSESHDIFEALYQECKALNKRGV